MWVYKTYPIKFSDIMLSKLFATIALDLTVLMVPIILYTSLGFVSVLEALLILVLAIIASITYSSFYLFLGLKHPNSSNDDVMIARQSTSTVIAVLIAMPLLGTSATSGIIVSIFTGSTILSIVGMLAFTAIFGLIWVLILRFKGRKLFVYKYY